MSVLIHLIHHPRANIRHHGQRVSMTSCLSDSILPAVLVMLWEQLSSTESNGAAKAIVILSHRWPEWHEIEAVETPLKQYVGNGPLLVLHGHGNPSSSAGGLLWHDSAAIGDRVCFRSQVCSSVNGKR